MEDTHQKLFQCKKMFNTGNVVQFMDEIRSNNFRVYYAEYNLTHQINESKSEIVDLFNCFVCKLNDRKNNLLTWFKCSTERNSYSISSVWITDYQRDIESLVPDIYDNFEWEELDMNINVHVLKFFKTVISQGDSVITTECLQ